MTLPPTPFTRIVDCRLPLQQAGMGGVTTPALAAAVAAEGGLGMVAAAGLTSDQVCAQVAAALELAGNDARVGVNFLVPFLDDQALEAASQVAALVECFYGDPDAAIVERVHGGGALAAWQVGSRDEARAAVDAGCDVIVAQGVEAGGHVRGTSPLLPLLEEVRGATRVPLVAAGGVGTGAAMAEVLLAGADAVRVGTRFVATSEADVHPAYRDALLASGAGDTVLAEAFSMGWPHAPHRVLRQCVDASTLEPAMRSPLPPTRAFDGEVASAALYAGESVGAVTGVLPAAAVVRELIRDAEAVLQRAAVGRREHGG
ncbi:MAG: nitronate monooxygenase [Actinobacteria bacterium]|nr:nitronate monooxygenase [Actinomycetota bacterium]